jgi:hypothetical protein
MAPRDTPGKLYNLDHCHVELSYREHNPLMESKGWRQGVVISKIWIFVELQRKTDLVHLMFKWHWEPTDHCLVAAVSELVVSADDKKFLCSNCSYAFGRLF